MTDQTQQAAMEREAFEAWYCADAEKKGMPMPDGIANLREDDHYGGHRVMLNGKWEGWQARAALAPAAPAVGAPVASGVLPLPAPAFELTWRDGAYRVSAPGLSAAKCYIADQMHEYAARCMLHAIPAPPAASLREQEDNAARYLHLRNSADPPNIHCVVRDKKGYAWAFGAALDERIDAQRLGREKDKA